MKAEQSEVEDASLVEGREDRAKDRVWQPRTRKWFLRRLARCGRTAGSALWGTGSPIRLHEIGFWVVASLFVLVAGRARSIGLDPHTLWNDDAWVAALTRIGFWEAVTAPTNAPPGFIAASWLMSATTLDPEVALQVLPFLAALASIPVVMLVAARLTNSLGLGIAAGALVVMQPALVHYSVFVKQYSLEFLGVSLTLLLAHAWLEELNSRRAAGLGVAATITATMGYGTVLAVAVLVNAAVLTAALRLRAARQSASLLPGLVLFAGFNAAMLAYYVLLLRPRAAGEPDPYWLGFFLSTASLNESLSFLRSRAFNAIGGAFPEGWNQAMWLAAVGLVWLALRRNTRWLTGAIALLAAGLLAASRLHLYPIGAGRTDIFAYPVILVLSVAGVAALTEPLGRARPLLRGVIAIIAVAWAVAGAPGKPYFDLDLSNYARTLDERAKPADGILVYPQATFLTTFYTEIPAELLEARLGVPYFRMRREGALTLAPGDFDRARIQAADFLLRGSYPRIWFFSTRLRAEYPQEPFLEMIERRGYRERRRWTSRIKTHLILYELVSGTEGSK